MNLNQWKELYINTERQMQIKKFPELEKKWQTLETEWGILHKSGDSAKSSPLTSATKNTSTFFTR